MKKFLTVAIFNFIVINMIIFIIGSFVNMEFFNFYSFTEGMGVIRGSIMIIYLISLVFMMSMEYGDDLLVISEEYDFIIFIFNYFKKK